MAFFVSAALTALLVVVAAAASQAATPGDAEPVVPGGHGTANKPAVGTGESVPGKTDNLNDGMLTPYKYIGNNFSLKFHKPSCPFAKAMWSGHAELFHFRKEAIAAKYAPCRYCLPPSWTNVSATILARPAQSAVHSGAATKPGM